MNMAVVRDLTEFAPDAPLPDASGQLTSEPVFDAAGQVLSPNPPNRAERRHYYKSRPDQGWSYSLKGVKIIPSMSSMADHAGD